MKRVWSLSASLLVATAFLTACGGSGGSNNGGNNPSGKPAPKYRVNWAGVPAEFHPTTEDFDFNTGGFEKVSLNVFGFTDDVEVVYSNDVPANTGFLRVFHVWKKATNLNPIGSRANGKILNISNQGTYECSITVTNGNITELEGGCYVRLQVFLPPGVEIEVYNVGTLITKRFIPIDTEAFLEQFDDATWSEEKFTVIENFMTSYEGTKKTPSLTSEQLGTVIADFARSEEKFKALRRLHSAVSDRENLRAMIESKFTHFDQDDALKIVGL